MPNKGDLIDPEPRIEAVGQIIGFQNQDMPSKNGGG